MTRRGTIRSGAAFLAAWAVAVLVILATVGHDARAEVAVSLAGPGRVGAVIEMRDLSFDPPLIWSPVRPIGDAALLLNPGGDSHGDGAPSIRINPATRLPEAVWAFRAGTETEIAFARFDGASWTAPPLLTSGGRSLGPRLFIDAGGNRRVAFWRRGVAPEPDGVYVTTLPAGELQWWAPQRVSPASVATRHPDLRTFPQYGTFIVGEEETAAGISIAVYHLADADGTTPPQRESDPWGRERVYQSESPATLDPRIVSVPSSNGRVPQIEWIESTPDGPVLGVIYYDTESLTWSTPTFLDYP